MPRRFRDSENPKDNNWRRLWERPSKKSHRERARLHRLSNNPSHPEDSIVPAHSSSLSDPIAMASNLANQSLEDQFLRQHQDMEAKQKEQARQMAEFRVVMTICSKRTIACRLVWKRIGAKRHEGIDILHPRSNKIKVRSPSYPTTVMQQQTMTGISPLPDLPPPKNNVEAESRKRPPCCSNRSVSGMHSRVRRGFSREQRQSKKAPENAPAWHWGVAPTLPFMYPTFGVAPAPYILASTTVRGPEDMISSPLG